MNVGQLRALLKESKDLPDNAPVLVTTRDHSYREARGSFTTAMAEGHGRWGEDPGEDIQPTTQGEYGIRRPALVVD